MQDVLPQEPAKKPTGKVSFRTARNAVLRHPIIFAGIITVSALVAAGVWMFMPLPKNTAASVLQFSGAAPRVINASTENQIDLRTYGSLQAAMLKRRQVLANALKNPEMEKAPLLKQQTDPIAWLDKNVQVNFSAGPEFMRVFIEGDQPDELVAILRALTASYLAAVDQRDNGDRKRRLVLIEESITLQQAEISSKLKRIDVIAQSLKTTDGPTLAIMESLNQDELRMARREMLELEKSKKVLMAETPIEIGIPKVSPGQIDDALRREPAMLQAEIKVNTLKQVLRDTESRYEPGTVNSSITRAKQDVKVAEESRDKLRLDLRTQVEISIIEQAGIEAKLKANRYKEAFDALERRRQISEQEIQTVVDKINKHGEYRLELEKLRKEVSSTERVLGSLTDERDRIRVEERAPSRVSLAEDAFVQSGVEGMRRTKMTLLSSIGCFLVGFISLVAIEHRGRRVTSATELSQVVGIRILGSIPVVKSDVRKANRILIESVDALRTQLLQSRSKNRPVRTVLIASGLSGEGKTTLSGHLAVSLSRAGYRVLMVDGDMHAPTAQRLFELPPIPGFCEVLRGESSSMDAVHATPVPGMFVMTAGSWNMATRQCLVGDRWGAVREALQQEYDFVIVDTAPLLLMADTLLLSKSVDCAILSVLQGFSRIGAVALAQDRLKSMGVLVLGAVVNGAAADYVGDYYGRYKYGAASNKNEADPIPLIIA